MSCVRAREAAPVSSVDAASREAPASAAPQIVARDLVKTYQLGGSVIGALQGISVEVERGEYLAVTGASGSGKSTFMNLDRRARHADQRLAQDRGPRARAA